MAKISTRQPNQSDQEYFHQKLLEVIAEGTQDAVSNHKNALLQASPDFDGLVENLREIFRAINDAGRKMSFELAVLATENFVLNTKYDEALDVLDGFTDVSYDDALDHATLDLMDAFSGSGAADTTPDGELMFDARVSLSKTDLKPILREAITRWVELKLS